MNPPGFLNGDAANLSHTAIEQKLEVLRTADAARDALITVSSTPLSHHVSHWKSAFEPASMAEFLT